jgi:hypothetical protein
VEDPVVKIKRGRGRPSANEPVYRWSQIERGRQVDVVGLSGTWHYVKMADEGTAVTVIGGPNGHTRTFPVTRVTAYKKADSDE